MSIDSSHEHAPLLLYNRGKVNPSKCDIVQWRLIETPAEYEAVIQLRTTAYAHAGKIDPTNDAIMRDQFDKRAKIVSGWHASKLIASLRIIIHEPGALWEHEQYVKLDHPDLPPKSETVEITRVCVDPAWAHTGLSLMLFQKTALEILRHKRRYILGSATRNALPIYTRIGCRVTDLQFRYEELGGGTHYIFVGDVVQGVGGYVAPWMVWSIFWSEVFRQARREGLLPPPPLMHAAKLNIWRLARPLLQQLMRKRRRRE